MIKLKKLKSMTRRIKACSICPKNGDRVHFPRGKLSSEIVFLVPSPKPEDMESECPLSGSSGNFFNEILKEQAQFDTQKDCLVVPITFCSLKLSKSNCHSCLSNFSGKFLKQSHVRLIVCCGKEVVKFLFNQGAAPQMLFGRNIRMEGWKPDIFVFSDPYSLQVVKARFSDQNVLLNETRFTNEARSFGRFLDRRGLRE